MGQPLANYQTDTLALLRDSAGAFNNIPQLQRWINRGRAQTAKYTGCMQQLITGVPPFGNQAVLGQATVGGAIMGTTTNNFNAIPRQEQYTYQWASTYLRRQYTGYGKVQDVSSIAVNWGATRPTIVYMDFDDYQAYCRSYNVLVSSYPMIWSKTGEGDGGKVWLYPIPSQLSEMEWNVTCTPSDIWTNEDPDALPDPFDDAVKFYAAGMAYFSSSRTALASLNFTMWADHCGINWGAVDRGRAGSAYWWQSLI